jgi:hypothetical protein
MVGLGGKTVIEDSQGVSDGSENGSEVQNEAYPEAEEALEPTPSTPTNPKKRTSDLYDKAHSEVLVEGVEAASRPAKRSRASLYSPKAKQAVMTQRETRAKARAAVKALEVDRIPRPTNPTAAKSAENSSGIPQKLPRGRPRKHKVPKKRSDPADHEDQQAIDDAGIVGNEEEEAPNAPDYGSSGLYMDPSPVKPISPDPRRAPAISAPPVQFRPRSDDEEADDEEETRINVIVQVGSASKNPEHDNGQVAESPTTIKDVISTAKLEEMLKTVQRVGQKQDKDPDKWEAVEVRNKAYSGPGKISMRKLGELIKTYRALPVLIAAGGEAVQVSQAKAAGLVEELQKEFEVVFSERLPFQAQAASQQTASIQIMLKDVYFLLVPNLVMALKLAVEAYQDEDLSDTEAMRQVVDLLVLLQKLGDRAIQQPKDFQPKNNEYQTYQPTRSIIQTVRILSKNLKMELRRRERIRKNDTWNAGALERERKRASEARREMEEKQLQRNEIYRRQQEVMNAKLNDPIHGPLFRAEIERAERRKAELQQLRSSQSRPYRSSQSSAAQRLEDDEDDPFAGPEVAARSSQSNHCQSSQTSHAQQLEDVYRDEDVADEPLTDITANCREDGSIAGTPNRNRRPKEHFKNKPTRIPMTDEEMTTFLDIMRRNIYKDRMSPVQILNGCTIDIMKKSFDMGLLQRVSDVQCMSSSRLENNFRNTWMSSMQRGISKTRVTNGRTLCGTSRLDMELSVRAWDQAHRSYVDSADIFMIPSIRQHNLWRFRLTYRVLEIEATGNSLLVRFGIAYLLRFSLLSFLCQDIA